MLNLDRAANGSAGTKIAWLAAPTHGTRVAPAGGGRKKKNISKQRTHKGVEKNIGKGSTSSGPLEDSVVAAGGERGEREVVWTGGGSRCVRRAGWRGRETRA